MLLVCRNSTDTAYFQRLRPYPRIALRRSHTRFKDYDKTPIGFGIVVFCIAKASCRCALLHHQMLQSAGPLMLQGSSGSGLQHACSIAPVLCMPQGYVRALL